MPEAPETVSELVLGLLAGAAVAIGFVGRWLLNQLGWYRDRQATTNDSLRADKKRLLRDYARLEASNAAALDELRKRPGTESTVARLEGDQATIVRAMSDTPTEPEERV